MFPMSISPRGWLSALLSGFGLLVAPVSARSVASASLPVSSWADMEVSTNVPFSATLDVAGNFSFSLACRTTLSNNVEVAFGTDVNANGVLDPEEVGRVVGWDCGAWFTRRGVDGAYVQTAANSAAGTGTLSWKLQVGVGGRPARLSATVGGAPVFADLPLEAVYSPSWNLLRLTGRGLDRSLETFLVSVTPDGTVFIVR